MDLQALYSEGDRLYWEGQPDEAEPLLVRAAEAGHAHAAFLLGRLYQGADRKDPAIRWYRLAAERGDSGAMIDLALLIEDDDREAAVRWTRLAVEVGPDVTANLNLGIFLEEDGLLEEAEQHYRIAARACFPAARHRLGSLLRETGRREEAEVWYRHALDERANSCDDPGDEDYEANTAIMCNFADLLEETGRQGEALSLYRLAAERGDPEAAEEAVRMSRV
jgi:TPR repeat protein